MGSEFVHLHSHTEYSLLDGANRVDEVVARAKELGMSSLAITDHGNMYGAVAFYKECKAQGVHPIIGCEMYVAPGDRREKTSKRTTGDENAYHFLLLVQNETGYRNLCRLVTKAYFEGYYYKPRIDLELLREYNEGLIATTACLQGNVGVDVLSGNRDAARKTVQKLSDIFTNGRLYLELQENGVPEQKVLNEANLGLAKEFGLPLVATNDNHFLKKDDFATHDILLCIGTRTKVADEVRMRFPTDAFYVRSPDEMAELFRYCPEAIDNTVRIAEQCRFAFDLKSFHLPAFDTGGMDAAALMRQRAREGLDARAKAGLIDTGKMQVYRDRLEYEVGVIEQMGFPGYFLIVSDIVGNAKQKDIPVGPGRGSAVGSLVAFALRITEIDPLRYGLLFERFLNPSRISMPDVDVDICRDRREEVIRYVHDRFGGDDYVAQVAAFGKMKARQALRDVGRVLDVPLGEIDKLAKLVPFGATLDEAWKSDRELRERVKQDPALTKVYDAARRLEGTARNSSIHPAGVVISDRPLVDYAPCFRGENGETVTHYDMDSVSAIGLVKFDFLGLKTLTVLRRACELVRQTQGVEVDLAGLPLDDLPTYTIMQAGDTTGIFQLESDGMRRLLRKLKPTLFEDVIAVLALYRPGPIESGMLDSFVERKHGREKVIYDLPGLEPILAETYGLITYQEQIIKIAVDIAGFTMAEADNIRKAVSKKNEDDVAKARGQLVAGMVEKGHPKKIAEQIGDLIAKFARYGFNKSHSTAYAVVAYQTAYMKAHYPVEFLTALLDCDRGNSDNVIKFIHEAKARGIAVLPPDVRYSELSFSVDNGSIRFGLAAIKNVGEGPVQAVIDERRKKPFDDLWDMLGRLDPTLVNKRVLEGFVESGSVDGFGIDRATFHAHTDAMLAWSAERQRDRVSGQGGLFDIGRGGKAIDMTPQLSAVEPWDDDRRLSAERNSIGFYVSGHPLDAFGDVIRARLSTTIADLGDLHDRAEVRLAGVVGELKTKNTPRGRTAQITLEDKTAVIGLYLSADTYEKVRDWLTPGKPIYVQGSLVADEAEKRVFPREIVQLEQVGQRYTRELHLVLIADTVDRARLASLRRVLAAHNGDKSVFFHIRDPEKFETVISASSRYGVRLSDEFIGALRTELRNPGEHYYLR